MKVRVFQVWNEDDKLSRNETPAVFVYGPTTPDAVIRAEILDTCHVEDQQWPDWSSFSERLAEMGMFYELTEADVL